MFLVNACISGTGGAGGGGGGGGGAWALCIGEACALGERCLLMLDVFTLIKPIESK